jgi:hypothetical protein
MYQLRFALDAGSGICLWSTNDVARDKFDYPVDLRVLPLSQQTIARGLALIARFDTCVDWTNPSGPSRWSSDDDAQFQHECSLFLSLLRLDLGLDFDVRDGMQTVPTVEYNR